MRRLLRIHKWPLLIALVVLLVRLVYLLEISQQPGFSVPMVDEKWHWEWAHEILTQSFWGEGAYFRAPLYPYFLALLSWIAGGSIFWTRFLQILVCCGTAFLLYRLAEKLFNERVALLAGFMYAFFGTLVFYEMMFLIPVVFLFFLVWGMYRLVAYRESQIVRTWIITGAVFGLAALARPNVLLVIPFLMIWLHLVYRTSRSFLSRLKLPVALLVGVVVVIVPVTVRNILVTGDFILISSQGGVNLYLGNNPYADGLSMLMPEVELDESVTWRQFMPLTEAAAEREAGRELSPAEQSSFWTRKAIDFIVHNPGKFLGLVWRKTVYLASGFENSDNVDIYDQRGKSRLYSILLWKTPLFFPFGVLLPLTLLGIYLHRDQTRRLIPLYIFIVAYSPSIVLFLVTARHRLPLVPFMIIIAAAGLVALLGKLRQMSARKLGVMIAGLAVVTFLVNRTYYEAGGASAFQIHFNDGIMYQRLGDYAAAEREYLLADREFPYSAPLINNLGFVQFKLGKRNEAEQNYQRAIRLKPGYGPPYNNLGMLVRAQGDSDSALTLYRMALQRTDPATAPPEQVAQVYLNLADVHEVLGNIDSAAAAFRQAIQADTLMAQAYFQAAAFFARHEQYDLTDSLYDRGRYRGDLPASHYFNWGLSYIERQRLSEGIAFMFRAIGRDPQLYQAYYVIAVSYLEGGMPMDSVYIYLQRCLAINPTYGPALNLKDAIER